MCWVSWDRIKKPKDMGGLGIRDIQHFNTALLAKQAWRIVTKPEGLFARVLVGKSCRNSSFLTVKLPKECSHGWQSIMAGRDLLVLKLSSVIGDGESINVWKDPWLSTDIPKRPYGPPPEHLQDLKVADLLTRESKDWNVGLIERILPHLVEEITLLKPSLLGNKDGIAWLGSRSGVYTTRSGYFAAFENEENAGAAQPVRNWKKLIWMGRTSLKLKLFLWRATQRALPTGSNL